MTMTKALSGKPVRSLFDGTLPEVGDKVRHRANHVQGKVVRVEQRRYCWVTVNRPVYPNPRLIRSGFANVELRDIELRLDHFHSLWTVADA